MGRIYDALVRAESIRRESSKMLKPAAAATINAGPRGEHHEPQAATRSIDSWSTETGTTATPGHSTETALGEDSVTGQEAVERLASLEVAVYALCDRLDKEIDERQSLEIMSSERVANAPNESITAWQRIESKPRAPRASVDASQPSFERNRPNER